MKKRLSITQLRLIFLAAFVCVGAFMFGAYRSISRERQENADVREALDLLLKLENLVIDTRILHNAQLGYIDSSQERYINEYTHGVRMLKRDTTAFSALQLPGQTVQKRELLDLVFRISNASANLIGLKESHGRAYAMAMNDSLHTEAMMDSIEKKVTDVEDHYRAMLNGGTFSRINNSHWATWQLLIIALLCYLILYFSFVTIAKDLRKLEQTDRLLRYNASLIRNISDPILTVDNKFNITNWNYYAEELYGYNEKEVLGKPLHEVLGLSVEAWKQPSKDKHSWKGEEVHYHKDGHPIEVQFSTSEIISAENVVTGRVTVIRDITERKMLEDQLQKRVLLKTAELANVFERITDAFIALDTDWRYVYVNNQAAIMHELPAEELIGKKIWELFPEMVGEPFYEALHLAQRTQEAQRVELYYAKKDVWYEDLIYPSENGISVYYHDITEEKKASVALQASNERFQLVAKATRDAIWDWDMIHDTVWGNDIFLEYLELQHVNNVPFSRILEHVHDEDRLQMLANFEKVLEEKGSTVTEEFRYIRSDGGIRTFYDRAYIIYNEDKVPIRMLGAMQDITEEKEYERKLTLEKNLSDTVINSLPGVFYLTNYAGKFYRWNKNVEKVTGYSAEELAKMHPMDLFGEDEKELMQSKTASVIANGEDYVESHFVSKDGVRTPFYFTGRYIEYEGEPCLLGVGIDITERIKSQEALKKSEEKFRTLIEQASDGIFISDYKGDYKDVNTRASMLTGYSKEELLKMNLRDILEENNLRENPLKFQEMIEGKVILTERIVKRKDGSHLHVEISAKQLPDGRFQGLMRDITARKHAEDSVRYSEEKRRLIMNAALDAIICIDTEGMITFWNPQAEKVFGWNANEAYGQRLSKLIIPERFRENHDKGMQQYNGDGQGPALNVLLELNAINRGGQEFPIELTVLPIKQGSEEFFCAFIRDITLRKKSQEALRLSENKYRLLFNQNPMPMWMISVPESDFLDVNPAAIAFYGFDREEFLGMNMADLRPKHEMGRMEKVMGSIPGGIRDVGVWTQQKKDGTLVQVNIITHDIIYQGRNAKLVLANDVTDKIQAEKNLERSREEFRELATHLEHIRETERTHMAREIHDELGQQLTGLKMDISWLKKKIHTEDKEIQAKVNETIQLIDKTVITVRRIATELRPSILDDLGLIPAMEWQSEEFQRRSEIQTSFSSNVPNAEFAPEIATGLFRIYQESLTNVLRHAEATEVSSELIVEPGHIEMMIRDNGKGFKEDAILHKKTLGILGMKERTKLMGGQYEIGNNPSGGTYVKIIVPLSERSPSNIQA